jgi:hypothetical protein
MSIQPSPYGRSVERFDSSWTAFRFLARVLQPRVSDDAVCLHAIRNTAKKQ